MTTQLIRVISLEILVATGKRVFNEIDPHILSANEHKKAKDAKGEDVPPGLTNGQPYITFHDSCVGMHPLYAVGSNQHVVLKPDSFLL